MKLLSICSLGVLTITLYDEYLRYISFQHFDVLNQGVAYF